MSTLTALGSKEAEMRIIGCDLHKSHQTIAMLDRDTGEEVAKTLKHDGDTVRTFYASLETPVIVGIEATGSMGWFLQLMEELGITCRVGHPAAIRKAETRRQKHDRRDASLLLKLLVEDRFPTIWMPSTELRELRALLLHRHQWVRMRTRVQNALHAIALSHGLRRGHALWNRDGQATVAALPLLPYAAERRTALLALYQSLSEQVDRLDERVAQAAARRPGALGLMTHPGVGPVPAENAVRGLVAVPVDAGLPFSPMIAVLVSLLLTLRTCLRTRAALHLEVIALRHQIHVLQRSRPRRLRLTRTDRLLWVWISRVWHEWPAALVIVKPETVVVWHRRGFRVFWEWKSRHRVGRPTLPPEVRTLIRTISAANPLWGAPRIHGQLLKLGIEVGQASVAKYMVRRRPPPSQTWHTFLRNHVGQIMAADFFVVPTASCRLLFVLILLAHDRRCVMHIAVTDHPTATWTAQQVRDAFPWDEAPRFLLHDRDTAFAGVSTAAMGLQEILTAPRSPWQNAYVERFIGSVRRECLDHVIILNAAGLRRVLSTYVEYYTASRTHLALEKDTPLPRPISPPTSGEIVAIPQVGGLHHRYERRAA